MTPWVAGRGQRIAALRQRWVRAIRRPSTANESSETAPEVATISVAIAAAEPIAPASSSCTTWTARASSSLPILRKDFVIDPYQVVESAVAGADAILLIVAALDDAALAALHGQAAELDLDVLVEVHDDAELERALEAVDPDLIGINNRNLADFTVDVERTYELLVDVPAGKTVVSESGFHSREQLLELERVGVDAVLVGESLMRAPDPGIALRVLTGGEGEAAPR